MKRFDIEGRLIYNPKGDFVRFADTHLEEIYVIEAALYGNTIWELYETCFYLDRFLADETCLILRNRLPNLDFRVKTLTWVNI